MALNNSQYDTIIRAYEQKQLHNRNVLDKRYKTVYNRLPELKEINFRNCFSCIFRRETSKLEISGGACAQDFRKLQTAVLYHITDLFYL